mgnify:CR=1 FL=1
MKRQGFLIEQIADMDNLYLAWIKARKGKQNKPAVKEFSVSLKPLYKP